MAETKPFPLVTGFLSLDLVNTEIIRRGRRHDLLTSGIDAGQWLETMKNHNANLDTKLLPELNKKLDQVLYSLHEVRPFLRKGFEQMADGNEVSGQWIAKLEDMIKEAPMSYTLAKEQLLPLPVGPPVKALLSLIAFDALQLFAEKKIDALKRCANPDCVLLFIDESGRRKWCSMKICGNRIKVARHQQRKRQ